MKKLIPITWLISSLFMDALIISKFGKAFSEIVPIVILFFTAQVGIYLCLVSCVVSHNGHGDQL